MAAGGKAYPVRMVVEVDQGDRFGQVREQGRGQVVIVAGAYKKDFWPLRGAFRPLLQAFSEAPVIAFGGPQTQLRPQFQQVQACGTTVGQTLLNRCL